jgi:hypothetical protein
VQFERCELSKKAWTFPTIEAGRRTTVAARKVSQNARLMNERQLCSGGVCVSHLEGCRLRTGNAGGGDPTAELVRFRPRPSKSQTRRPPRRHQHGHRSCRAAGGRAPECSCAVCPITISFASGLDQHCGDDATAHAVVKPACSFHGREPVFPHLSITPIHRAALSLLALQPPPPDFPVLATPPNAATSTSPKIYALTFHHLRFAALPVWASVGKPDAVY